MSRRYNTLSNRKLLVMGVFIAVGVVFLVRLFALQVLDRHYKQLADNNALRFEIGRASCRERVLW